MTLFLILLAIVVILLSFYGGIIVGIADCKRRYHLPKGDYFPSDEVNENDGLNNT